MVEWAQSPRDKSQSQSHQLLETQQSYETEWDMVNAVSFRKKTCANGEGEPVHFLSAGGRRKRVFLSPAPRLAGSLGHSLGRGHWAFTVSVGDLRSVTVKDEGWTFLILKLKEPSTSLPALHFHQGGSREFLDGLRRFALLTE